MKLIKFALNLKHKKMNETMIIKKEIDFDFSKKKVWNLLTNPEITKQYMYGCEVLSEWTVGSPIIWKGITEDGAEVIYVKGEIIEIEKEKKVTFTMFDPNKGMEDKLENYVNLTYELQKIKNGTKLILTQGDFSKAEDGKNRFEEASKGWEMVFPIMEKVISEL